MKFSDLSIETQQRLNCERLNLRNRSINSAYEVLFYNQSGTRYFYADAIKIRGMMKKVTICRLVVVLNGQYDMDVSVSPVRNK